MQRIISLCAALLIASSACQAQSSAESFQLEDFLANPPTLAKQVDQIYDAMTPEQRAAQMIVTSLGRLGKNMEDVRPLVEQSKVGGIIFLSGDPEEFKKEIEGLQSLSKFPLLMSMDAEPSLFNRRMPGTPEMSPTAELTTTEAVQGAVDVIDSTLHYVGFQHNYAPVIDVSPNNEAIGNRTFGSDSATIIPLATQFIQSTQQDQIVATAKHFPGHGRVSGDTHKKLVYIDGRLTEVHLYKPLIEAGVASIMVGHIAIENNERYQTDGMPSTLSRVVVTDLLRKEFGFEGLIVTDAMNMGAVSEIPNSTLLAAKAGCDIILMPPDEVGTLQAIIDEMEVNQEFEKQIEASVKRILRLKLCLGMEF
jgi:beta-N-acetylhexosaminidase